MIKTHWLETYGIGSMKGAALCLENFSITNTEILITCRCNVGFMGQNRCARNNFNTTDTPVNIAFAKI